VTTNCPAGHVSTTTDYCDVCGAPMAAAPAAAPEPQQAPEVQRCPRCGEVREGRFCETCGYDSDLGDLAAGPATLGFPATTGSAAMSSPVERGAVAAEAPSGEPANADGAWIAVVRADRAWFEEVRRRGGPDAGTLEFPRYCPERRFPLSGSQMAIGRRSRSRGIEPEIDLSGPPLDPGVSALHALLVARPDGGWDLVDVGSTNGTVLDDEARPVPPNTPVPLAHGTRVKLGAWTTITLHSRESGN
jgi:FHA domain